MNVDDILNEIANNDEQQLYTFIRDVLKVPVSRHALNMAIRNREIVPTQIGYKNLFSNKDAIDWIKSRKGVERWADRKEAIAAAKAAKAAVR